MTAPRTFDEATKLIKDRLYSIEAHYTCLMKKGMTDPVYFDAANNLFNQACDAADALKPIVGGYERHVDAELKRLSQELADLKSKLGFNDGVCGDNQLRGNEETIRFGFVRVRSHSVQYLPNGTYILHYTEA